MHFNPALSGGTAVVLALIAAFMWGTWAISLKYLGDYPIDGFYVTLFATSLVFVWTVGFVLDRDALLANIAQVWTREPIRVVVTLAGGLIYVFGIRLSLTVMSTIGLSLAQPIQSATFNLASLAVTITVGGVPSGVSVPVLILATIILIAAVVASLFAGHFRSQAQALQPHNKQHYVPMSAIWSSVGLVLLSSLLIIAYPFAVSFGLVSRTQSHGLAVLPFMALLATGAFTGSVLSSGLILTVRRQWRRVWTAGFRIHKFGIFAGLFHYGGNILQAFAASFLSAAVAFPLGITSGLWTTMWGISHGEFRGSPPRAYFALFAGVILYIIGAYLIAVMSG
jgi:hypothetical protein